MKKTKLPMFLLVVILLIPFQAYSELEGRAIMDESIPGLRLYKIPKVIIPEGWVENKEAGQQIKGVFLTLRGIKGEPNVTMYAMALRSENPRKSLSSFIQGDLAHFKNKSDKGVVTKIPDMMTKRGKISTYRFSYNHQGKRYVQTVVFAKEADYFLSFALTGKSKVLHNKYYPSFKNLLSEYK